MRLSTPWIELDKLAKDGENPEAILMTAVLKRKRELENYLGQDIDDSFVKSIMNDVKYARGDVDRQMKKIRRWHIDDEELAHE